MAGNTRRKSGDKPAPKVKAREQGKPAAGRPGESEAVGRTRDGESSPLAASDGSRVAVLGRSVVSPRLKR